MARSIHLERRESIMIAGAFVDTMAALLHTRPVSPGLLEAIATLMLAEARFQQWWLTVAKERAKREDRERVLKAYVNAAAACASSLPTWLELSHVDMQEEMMPRLEQWTTLLVGLPASVEV